MSQVQDPRAACQGGLTMVETMVAVLLIGLTVTGSVSLLRAVLPGVVSVHNRAVATQLAQGKVEQLKNELLMQPWHAIPTANTTAAPTPPYVADVNKLDQTVFTTDWEYTFVDPSGAVAIPTPAGVVTGLLRLRAHTAWTEKKRKSEVEIISYMSQRELATPTPGNSPTPSTFHTVIGTITDGGQPIKGGAIVLLSALSNPENLYPLWPSFVRTAPVFSAFANSDGTFKVTVPTSAVSYNFACLYVRMSLTGGAVQGLQPTRIDEQTVWTASVSAGSAGTTTVDPIF